LEAEMKVHFGYQKKGLHLLVTIFEMAIITKP